MSLQSFKAAAVATINTKPDSVLLGQAVQFMRKVGLSEREIYRAALSVIPDLDTNRWADCVKEADMILAAEKK